PPPRRGLHGPHSGRHADQQGPDHLRRRPRRGDRLIMSTEQNINTATNGHDHGTNGTTLRPSPAYQWLPAADLPDHLSGAVIPTPPTEDVDTSEVWEKGQQLDPAAARAAFEQARVMAQLQEEYSGDIESALSPEDLAKDDA